MNDATLIWKVLEKAPELAVLCFIVWVFVKKMALFVEAIKAIHEEHLEARKESRAAIHDNTIAMRENTAAMSKLVMEGQYRRP